ncbi:MAG: hypothetical protein CMB67_04535 [Euryarchaeota archaeon]|nr:hypothetical protein [Euryarchaeota archaeon]|tara:strand:- start:425 stop:841 length:417 start_codon:yes stop_codon:yes gene_type:complete
MSPKGKVPSKHSPRSPKRHEKKHGHGKYNWGKPQDAYNVPKEGLDDSRISGEEVLESESIKLLEAVRFNMEMMKLNDDDLKAAQLAILKARTGDSFEIKAEAALEAKRLAEAGERRIQMLERLLKNAAAEFDERTESV